MKRHIVIAGGSGFLGQVLERHFEIAGDAVTVLTRSPGPRHAGGRAISWDGATLGPWHSALDGADVLINLAGRSVNCRYHARNRRDILDSRVHSVCPPPDGCWK